MDISNPLSNLKMKWWHAILIVASFSTFELSLFVKTVIFDNFIVALISLGLFFVGLGEFANQSFQCGIAHDKNGAIIGTTERDVRTNTVAGYAFDLLGIALIAVGLYYLFA